MRTVKEVSNMTGEAVCFLQTPKPAASREHSKKVRAMQPLFPMVGQFHKKTAFSRRKHLVKKSLVPGKTVSEKIKKAGNLSVPGF